MMLLLHLLLVLIVPICRGDSVGSIATVQTAEARWSNTSYAPSTVAASTEDVAAIILAGLGDSSTSLSLTSGIYDTSSVPVATGYVPPIVDLSSTSSSTSASLYPSTVIPSLSSLVSSSPTSSDSVSGSISTRSESTLASQAVSQTLSTESASSIVSGSPLYASALAVASHIASSSLHSADPSASGTAITRSVGRTGVFGTAIQNATRTSNETVSDCQEQLVSWSMATSKAYLPAVTQSTMWFTRIMQVTPAWGNADVYTTIDGFAHAQSLDITSTRNFSFAQYSSQLQFSSTIANLTSTISIPPKPTCTIDISSCAALYSSYAQELGVTDTAVPWVPWTSIDAPNSPRCLQTTDGPICITRPIPTPQWPCAVSASSVHLYYWPPKSAAPNATITKTPTTVYSGITMTSPSVYLSFDSVGAAEAHGGAWITCTGRSWPTYSLRVLDGHYTGHWLSMHPDRLSTLEKAIDETFLNPTTAPYWTLNSPPPSPTLGRIPDAAITAMANPNATDYAYWAQVIFSASANFEVQKINLDHLTRPNPRAYYLQPHSMSLDEKYARGCHPQGPHPYCNTIFDGEYRAQISVPPELISAHPAWAKCKPAFWGIRDPPEALHETSEAEAPAETTTASTPTQSPATPASPVKDPTPTATDGAKKVDPPANEKKVDPPPADDKSAPTSPVQNVNRPSDTSANPPADKAAPSNNGPANNGDAGVKAPADSTRQQTQVVSFTPQAPPPDPAPANALEALTRTVAKETSAAAVAVFTAGSSTITATSQSGAIVFNGKTLAPGEAVAVGNAQVSNFGDGVAVKENPAASPLGTIGNQPVLPNPSGDGFVVGTETVTSGDLKIGDAAVQVNPDRLVVGSSTIFRANTPIATLDGTPVVSDGNGLAVGTQRITSGRQTINGVVVEATGDRLIIGSSTINLAAVATIAGAPVVPDGDGFVVGTQKVTPGRQTINGVVVEATGDRLIIGSSTVNLQRSTVATLAGTPVVSRPSGFVVGTQTITSGLQTINGVPVSLDATALVIGSTTIALAPAITTVAGSPVLASPSGVQIGDHFVSKGAQTTINGVAISVGADSVVVGSQTFALTALATVGGQTIAANPSGVVIGGKTLTVGERTIIAGTVISVISNGIIVGSSTITKASSSPLITTIAGSRVSADASRIVIGDSTTLSRGQNATLDGTIVAFSTNGLVTIIEPTGRSARTTAVPASTTPASTTTARPTGSAARLIPSITVVLIWLCIFSL